jgi:hypothetical protein
MFMDRGDLAALLGCGLGVAMMFVAFLVALAVGAFISYQLYLSAKQLPPANRKLTPASVFLLLVPVVNLVWLFFVVIKLSQGYQEYFAANPRPGVGDCGYGVGLGWAVAVVCVIVPVAHFFAGLAALILMVLYLVKMSQLRALVAPATPS